MYRFEEWKIPYFSKDFSKDSYNRFSFFTPSLYHFSRQITVSIDIPQTGEDFLCSAIYKIMKVKSAQKLFMKTNLSHSKKYILSKTGRQKRSWIRLIELLDFLRFFSSLSATNICQSDNFEALIEADTKNKDEGEDDMKRDQV